MKANNNNNWIRIPLGTDGRQRNLAVKGLSSMVKGIKGTLVYHVTCQ